MNSFAKKIVVLTLILVVLFGIALIRLFMAPSNAKADSKCVGQQSAGSEEQAYREAICRAGHQAK